MADQDKPRVRLPDTMPWKPVVPGPNSWAQSQQEEQQRSTNSGQTVVGRATNRDRYEHKPVPPPPAGSSAHDKHLPAKAYIQPAIPLANPRAPLQPLQSQQKRAVTDPVAPKPLFAGRKLSVAKLRKKYSFSKSKDEISEPETIPAEPSSPIVRLSSEKAAEVLGLYPPPENKPKTPPASSLQAPVPYPFPVPSESVERTASPAPQVQSTPVPTRRYLRENDLPTPTTTKVPTAPIAQVYENPQDQNKAPERAENGMATNGMLHPPRLGRFGNVGEVGLVNEMHRVESFSGIIENAESSPGHIGQMNASSAAALSHSSMTQDLNVGGLLPPVVYSPSNYGGVWESDPAVGYSLPPFTPTPNRFPRNTNAPRDGNFDQPGTPLMPNTFINGHGNENRKDISPGPQASIGTNTNQNPHTDRSPDYYHPFPSANSWVSDKSFTSHCAPLSAILPRSYLNQYVDNSVPSPPHNQHEYQRPGSMSAAMARLELTLHHHLDSNAGSLSRLITDKHDRMMDQTIRRLENLEETVSKGFRNLKADLKDIRKDVGNLKEHFKDGMERCTTVQDVFEAFDRKLEALEKGVAEHSCNCQLPATERRPRVPERECPQEAVSHRRTESAHGALGQGERRQQYQSGASRSSNSARHSGNSNKAHRSDTLKKQSEARMSDEMATRREYFAELGAARGPMPDLRDHPAYSGMQQTQANTHNQGQNALPSMLSGLPYEHPSLSDGRWYEQAYGQNQ